MLSDEEVICEFMGWARNTFKATPKSGHLGLCHEVEERLTDEQQWQYIELLRRQIDRGIRNTAGTWFFLHASAKQKISALASVLRGGSR